MNPIDRIDHTLAALGSSGAAPAPGPELEAALRDLQPVRTRVPMRQLGWVVGASLAYEGAFLYLVNLRGDLDALPGAWVILYALAWLLGFTALLWLALVPRRGDVLPRWRAAAIGAVVAGIAFPLAGLLFAQQAPGASVISEASVAGVARDGQWCGGFGLLTALVPAALASIALRRAVAVQSRWVGAAIGASGGCLGGLMLHFHCPIADHLHVGIVHGGLVVVAALLGAAIVPRAIRT
jgi:hypothetical protein